MNAVLADMRERFPHANLSISARGNSILKASKSGKSFMSVCSQHCQSRYACRKCGKGAPSVRPSEAEVLSDKGRVEERPRKSVGSAERVDMLDVLRECRARFPGLELKIAERRSSLDGKYHILRKFPSHRQWYRICLLHGRVHKQCKECSGRFSDSVGSGVAASEQARNQVDTCGRPISSDPVYLLEPVDPFAKPSHWPRGRGGQTKAQKSRKPVDPEVRKLYHYMVERFPEYKLRVGMNGKTVQRKFGSSWLSVCATHCREMRACRKCGNTDREEKRRKATTGLLDLQSRFPMYDLKVSSKLINGEYRILRTMVHENAKSQSYAICVPHGKLLKNCAEGCNPRSSCLKRKRGMEEKARSSGPSERRNFPLTVVT